ncbi:hypothetical protein [Streptomyces sp. N35]|uniref:hypothetical protein n=1 Tax=Streptomyces sp. N35 TaxID=2795730 RepID=UPI0018F390F5|nr:hypothetical protein [Streptomyces sp. N35]
MNTPDDPAATQPKEAVPTEYGGITFRSRLEADWAKTLDTHSIKWCYEPEAVTLPSGAVYIPDFWLPDLGTWIEAKGPGIPRTEKAAELARTIACTCEGACGCPWPGGRLLILGRQPLHRGAARNAPRWGYADWDTPFGLTCYFTICPHCRRSQWITLRRPWTCRVCREPIEKNQAVFRPIDHKMRFGEPTRGDAVYLDLTDAEVQYYTAPPWDLDPDAWEAEQ